MNITRIQQEIIKDVLADKFSGKWFFNVSDSEAIIFTEYQVYVLDPKDFLLDLSKLHVTNSVAASKILDSADDAKPAVKTGQLRANGKSTLLELKCGDELIYVDTSLLKYFDKSAEFEAVNKVSPVYVYEDDILVGCVLPVKV